MISCYYREGNFLFENIKDIVTRILRQVIDEGKGIEVNTSCYHYGLSDLTPFREILRLYRELGGMIITVGSDTHKPEHLAVYIKETIEQLREMGFLSGALYNPYKIDDNEWEKSREILEKFNSMS